MHQLPARHLRAGQALLKQSLQKHWPTDLLLGLESQSRGSQECSSQATPVLVSGDENKFPSLALPSCCPWVGDAWGGVLAAPDQHPPNPSPAGNVLPNVAHACCPGFKIKFACPHSLGWSGWWVGAGSEGMGLQQGRRDEGAGWWGQQGPGQAEREGNPLDAESGPVEAGGPCSPASQAGRQPRAQPAPGAGLPKEADEAQQQLTPEGCAQLSLTGGNRGGEIREFA